MREAQRHGEEKAQRHRGTERKKISPGACPERKH